LECLVFDAGVEPLLGFYKTQFAAISKKWKKTVHSNNEAVNEAAKRRTLARDTIWQGNCDVADQPCRSKFASLRITSPIEYPISNCPAKSGAASFKRLYRK
jgi:hypothetical protein